jgi:nitrogen fixation protein FixH
MNPWPAGIVGGLGVVVAVNLWMLRVAASDPPIPEAERPYEAGVAFEATLAAQRASNALGFRAELDVLDGRARLRVKDPAGAPVDGLRGVVQVRRADRADADFKAAWQPRGAGVYEADTAFPSNGVWRLQSQLDGASAPFLDDRRVAVGL